MASYDLKCGACGRDFELYVQGFLKEDHKVCPDCGSRDVVQLFKTFLQGRASDSSGGSGSHTCAPSGGFT